MIMDRKWLVIFVDPTNREKDKYIRYNEDAWTILEEDVKKYPGDCEIYELTHVTRKTITKVKKEEPNRDTYPYR